MMDTDNESGHEKAAGTVLLIEDSEDIRGILHFMLEREGYGVQTAEDGRMALWAIENSAPPALVILDVMLPFVDGFALLRKIRETEEWRNVPVLMLTAKSGEKNVVRGLDTGAEDYMIKPFDSAELMARVRRLLRNRRL